MRRRPDTIRKNKSDSKPTRKPASRTGFDKPERKNYSREDSGTERRSKPAEKFGSSNSSPRKSYTKRTDDAPRKTSRYSSDDKPFKRTFKRDENSNSDRRPSTSKFGGDRPVRKSYSKDERPSPSRRPSTSKFGDDRPVRKSYSKDDRPSTDRRPSTSKFGDDRPVRKSYSKDERPSTDRRPSTGKFGDDRPVRKSYSKDERPTTSRRPSTGKFGDDRPVRKSYSKDDRPSTDRRPSTGKFGDDRPVRKSYSKDDRPSPSRRPSTSKFGDDRPVRKSYSKDDRPTSSRNPKDRFVRDDKKPSTSKTRTSGDFENKRYSKDSDEKQDRRTTGGYRERPSRNESPEYRNKSIRSASKRAKEQSREEDVSPLNIRLNRYISNAGICSRREADKLIGAGLVSVNGVIITEMGHQVKPGDDVRYNNSRLNADKRVYILINKPKDTITTLDDPDKRRIITDLVNEDGLPRIYPVGRLDRNTTGVLLLTNDGELTQRLMHPKYEVKKIYLATLIKAMRGEDLWTLQNGIELEDGFIKPDSVGIPDPTLKNEVGIEIHSGRNRIVHRMFEHLGYPLEKLDRVWYAGLTRKGLKRGEWRHLEDRELKALKKLVKMG